MYLLLCEVKPLIKSLRNIEQELHNHHETMKVVKKQDLTLHICTFKVVLVASNYSKDSLGSCCVSIIVKAKKVSV